MSLLTLNLTVKNFPCSSISKHLNRTTDEKKNETSYKMYFGFEGDNIHIYSPSHRNIIFSSCIKTLDKE